MKISNKTINGFECEIHADEYGTWHVQLDGKSIGKSSQLLDSAIQSARTELNKQKVKVKVPFILASEGKPGIATGLHARNRKILTKINGQAQQLDLYTKTLKPTTPLSVVKRIIECREQARDLSYEASRLERENAMNLTRAVEQALEEAVKKIGEHNA